MGPRMTWITILTWVEYPGTISAQSFAFVPYTASSSTTSQRIVFNVYNAGIKKWRSQV